MEEHTDENYMSDEDVQHFLDNMPKSALVTFDEIVAWVRKDAERIIEALDRLVASVGDDEELAICANDMAVVGSFLDHAANLIDKFSWSADKINELWEEPE